MHPAVAFDDVARALAAGASTVDAAEAHGCLCGALCLRPDYSFADWTGEIFDEAPQAPAAADPLAMLFEESAGVLSRAEMEFEPLLPDDDVALAGRVEALSAWCRGFLYGFGAAGIAEADRLPPGVSEVLDDLAQIAQAGAVGSEDPETEEQAYVELVEFLRAAVQLAYDELAALRMSQPPSSTGH